DPTSGKILDVNPAAVDYYGWTAQQMKGMRVDDISTLSAIEIKNGMELAMAGQQNYFQVQHRKSDGTVVDLEIYSGPIEIDGRTMLYSATHDITQRVAVQRELEDSDNRFRRLI